MTLFDAKDCPTERKPSGNSLTLSVGISSWYATRAPSWSVVFVGGSFFAKLSASSLSIAFGFDWRIGGIDIPFYGTLCLRPRDGKVYIFGDKWNFVMSI